MAFLSNPLVLLIAFLVFWVALQKWILPKMGIST